MFIKFSDKTKNIIVKKTHTSFSCKEGSLTSCDCNPSCMPEVSEENTIYLDNLNSSNNDDIRINILKEYENK